MAKTGWFYTKTCKKGRKTNKKQEFTSNFEAQIPIFQSSSLNPKMQLLINKKMCNVSDVNFIVQLGQKIKLTFRIKFSH